LSLYDNNNTSLWWAAHHPPAHHHHPHIQEEDRVVLIRFGHDADPVCMLMDETLAKIADAVKNFCIIYCVDITEVPDFNEMYELYDPMAIM
jgi:U5 snRNP protein, DIM1 family